MSVNVFKTERNTLPQNDPKIVRIKFDSTDMGATKSHISKSLHKNDFSIQHVGNR